MAGWVSALAEMKHTGETLVCHSTADWNKKPPIKQEILQVALKIRAKQGKDTHLKKIFICITKEANLVKSSDDRHLET